MIWYICIYVVLRTPIPSDSFMAKQLYLSILVMFLPKLQPGYPHHLDEINNDKPKCERKRKEIKVN